MGSGAWRGGLRCLYLNLARLDLRTAGQRGGNIEGIGQLAGDDPASTATLRAASSVIPPAAPSCEVRPAITSVPAISTPPSIARLSITIGMLPIPWHHTVGTLTAQGSSRG